MPPRQRDNWLAVGMRKTVSAHQERVSPLLNKIRKGRLDLAWATCIHGQQVHPKSMRHHLRFAIAENGVGRVAEVSDRLAAGTNSSSRSRRFAATSTKKRSMQVP